MYADKIPNAIECGFPAMVFGRILAPSTAMTPLLASRKVDPFIPTHTVHGAPFLILFGRVQLTAVLQLP